MPRPEFVDVTYFETTPDGISRRWPAIMSSLKSLLETGTALAIPTSAPGIGGL
ncbi:hypothetical protein [Bradyrhizobium sp.]|uniref:hypothetical protein n=1 Tax=Bradyrhizobium sp. TaxID=376 RepID=UPI003C513708